MASMRKEFERSNTDLSSFVRIKEQRRLHSERLNRYDIDMGDVRPEHAVEELACTSFELVNIVILTKSAIRHV